MINKLTITSLYTIALVSFSQATLAENNLNTISDTKSNPLTSEQVTIQQSNQLVISQSTLAKPKSNATLSKSVKTDSTNSDFDNENVNWVPSEWYSPY